MDQINLEHSGYKVGPATTIVEDNQRASKFVENGRSNSSRTRPITIRYYFMLDRNISFYFFNKVY